MLDERIMKLWMLLDDIDTADDMAKDNDKWYRDRVRHLQQKRWEIYNPDENKGYAKNQ